MLKELSDSAGYPDILAMVAAIASVSPTDISETAVQEIEYASLSGASGSSSRGILFLFRGMDQESNHLPILRVELSPDDPYASDLWMDRTFAALEARLSAPPDPDLITAAEHLAARLSSTKRPDFSDEWIEEISEQWSKFRD